MSKSDFSSAKAFRIYSSSDNAFGVAHDLEYHFAPYAVVRNRIEGEDRWHVFEVDDELLRRLKYPAAGHAASLSKVLNLYKGGQGMPHILAANETVAHVLAAPSQFTEPHV